MSQILGRFADRKRPDVYVYNWIQQTKDKGKKDTKMQSTHALLRVDGD